jgi:osmotically-inducible protein OsmY
VLISDHGCEVEVSARPAVSLRQSISDCAESRLRSNAYLALKNVSCDYHDGVLTLRGCLPTYYLKQIAQEAVARIEGVERIANEIEVVSSLRRAVCPA